MTSRYSRQSVTHANGQLKYALLRSLPFVAVFSPQVFFSFSAIVGFQFSGSGESPAYIIFLVTVGMISVVISLWQLLETQYLPPRNLFLVCLPVFVVLIFLIESKIGRTETQSLQYMFYWLALGVPALIFGVSSGQSGKFRPASLSLEPIMIVMTIAVTKYALENLGGIQVYGLGGETYQTAAYLAGLAYSLNLYHILNGDSHIRWGFMRTRAYFLIGILLLPIQVAACLMSGGRGGFVLIAFATVTITWASIRVSEARMWTKLTLAISTLAGGTVAVVPALLENEHTARIIERVFAYIGSDGLAWAGTSGRGEVYEESLQSIKASPQFGYGLFSWNGSGYPHNLFLEWFLNGGIPYVLFWFALVWYMWRNFRTNLLPVPGALIMLPILLFPLIMLMFSGTYWGSPSFWYVAGCLLSLSLPARNLRSSTHREPYEDRNTDAKYRTGKS